MDPTSFGHLYLTYIEDAVAWPTKVVVGSIQCGEGALAPAILGPQYRDSRENTYRLVAGRLYYVGERKRFHLRPNF